MTGQAIISVGDIEIAVTRRTRSNSALLTVERDGTVTLDAPKSVEMDWLRSFVQSKRQWLYRKVAEKAALEPYRPVKELVTGEVFAYLGRNYRLLVRRQSQKRVRLHQGRLLLDPRDDELAIVAWYRENGLRWIERRLPKWTEHVGVEPKSLDVRALGYRWGSASKSGTIHINWMTMQLRPALIEYVVVHELTHLHVPNHSPSFWKLVRRTLPNADELREELSRAGAQLWAGDAAKPTTNRGGVVKR